MKKPPTIRQALLALVTALGHGLSSLSSAVAALKARLDRIEGKRDRDSEAAEARIAQALESLDQVGERVAMLPHEESRSDVNVVVQAQPAQEDEPSAVALVPRRYRKPALAVLALLVATGAVKLPDLLAWLGLGN